MMEKLQPRLRFPEFANNEEIKKYSFNNLFSFSTGKNIKQNEASPEFDLPCVRYGELYHMYNEVIKVVINSTNLPSSELVFSEGNEILLPSAGEDPLDIGSASALTIPNVAIGRTINILRPLKKDIYSQLYVSYYINHRLRKKISSLAKGVSISNVYNSDLKTLEILLPSLVEQQKIATFLTAVDDKLALLKEKKNKLEQYKKGVMQKIFSQELRFKDEEGNDYPEWEEKRLGEVCDFYSGGTPTTTNKKYYGGNIPFIKSGEISSSQTNQFITELGLKNSSAKMIYKGDILYALYGATSGEVSISKLDGAINQAVLCIKSTQNHIYLFQYLKFQKENIVNTFIQGGQGNLSANIIKELNVIIPTISEQSKIANLLTAIDEKIEVVNQQIKNTEEYKKGLLQGMFC
jgi:type I restriction enzyme S subunit